MSKAIVIHVAQVTDTRFGTPQQMLPVAIPLPTWTDPTSVATFITAAVGVANAVLAVLHPGYHEPVIVEALVAPVSLLIAGAAMIANVLRHSKATVAALSR